MNINVLAGVVFLCGAMTTALAIYAWDRRATPGARPFAFFMASLAIYILGYSLELTSTDLGGMLFWSRIEYIGILTFPTIFLIFVIQYNGQGDRLSRAWLALAFLLPVLFLIAKFGDEGLHLIYASASVDTSGWVPMLAFERGPLYLVIVAYNLLVVTAGNVLLLLKRRHASALYRRQTAIILSVAFVLYLLYAYYLSGLSITPGLRHLDLNPVVYTLWGLAIALAIFQYRLLDLTPVARDALIEMLNDGVIVLDEQARVVDANPQAHRLMSWNELPVGRPAGPPVAGWIGQLAADGAAGPVKLEAELQQAGVNRHCEVTVSPLRDRGSRRIGYLLVVHDISHRKAIEEELRDLSLADDLTGLTNRRGFKVLGGQLLAMAGRMKLNTVLFYLDLDRLKTINDTLGHAAGDRALVEVAEILKGAFRASDVVARVGGDEFVVLALESADNSAEVMLTRLEGLFAARNAGPGRDYQLSVSMGLAHSRTSQPASMEALLHEADQAMYVQKRAKNGAGG